jgi:hypothetical protein
MKQLGWSSPDWRTRISWSTSSGYQKRFSILPTTDGYIVTDHQEKECRRVLTLAAARAWAGIRVGEEEVRHGGFRD